MSTNLTAEPLMSVLTELALDLRWCWNHATDELWRRLDPELWNLTHNPWVVLQTVSRQAIKDASADLVFRKKADQMLCEKRMVEDGAAWFQATHPEAPFTSVAYFSMEFMLSEALPIYSGGLGNVAGDLLKAASDLGVPLVGVGLLYQQGYFRQYIDRDGFQHALYPFNDPGQLPIQPVRDAIGEWLRIPLHLPEATVWVRSWQANVGRTRLYLLDTNDPANLPTHRCITSQLYGGGPELRLQQEIVLGLAGWRLLYALGIRPEVCHLNEGHAAFAVLERALSYMEEHHQPFDVALMVTRAGNLFTTHTSVEVSLDRFPPRLIRQYLERYAEHNLRLGFDELLSLGRRNRLDNSEPFNMASLAIRGSGAVNGVSRLHSRVSKRLFQPLFPRWPEAEVPVGYVTNGVHVPSWDSVEADKLWSLKCGKERWRGTLQTTDNLQSATDEELWELRTKARRGLIEYTRERLSRQRALQGATPTEIAQSCSIFHPDSLTIGFARRFATYKRPNLLLQDPDRLVRIITNPQYPVQLIISGKAHPKDDRGQTMIKQWSDFIARPDVRPRVVFLSDYDVLVTAHLVQGVDLWLNTSRRPWEASGTSGMKVLVNGGLNLSELDGWWSEAYSPELGWAIGDGQEHGDDSDWDTREGNALYDLLEREIVPVFYTRDKRGIPTAWIEKMRASMAQLTPRFSSNRALREYVETYYLPASTAYRDRAVNQSELGIDLSDWSKSLAQHWSDVRFGATTSRKEGSHYIFEVELFFGELSPNDAEVEIYAEASTDVGAFRQKMDVTREVHASDHHILYSAAVPANRPASDYTPRVIPCKLKASVPLEAPYILWQH